MKRKFLLWWNTFPNRQMIEPFIWTAIVAAGLVLIWIIIKP